MGFFNEINSEKNIRRLQKPLLKAIESNNEDIVEFCRNHVYPLYKSEVAEAFSKEDDYYHLKIKQTFEN